MKIWRLWGIVAALLLFLVPNTALAGLIGISFTDPEGTSKSVPGDTVFINPAGDLTVILSAGLDRKVAAHVLNDQGGLVASQASGLLGATDKVTFDGQTYYGATLALATGALAEGDYTIRSQILDANGAVVASEDHGVTVDVTAPTIGGVIQWIRSGLSYGSIELFSNSTNTGKELRLDMLSDEGSGLDSALYFTIDPQGERRKTQTNLETATGVASTPISIAAGSSMAPSSRGTYTIGYIIRDKAGNSSEISRQSAIDNITPPLWVEVYDSQQNKWLPYTSGMTVYENPISYRVKTLKNDHTDFNNTEFGWVSAYNAEDTDYYYLNRTLEYPQGYYYFRYYTKAGRDVTISPRSWNFTLDGTAELGPGPNGITGHIEGDSADTWVGQVPRFSQPAIIDKVKIFADPRSYDQKAWVSGYPGCLIPAGETSCEHAVSYSYTSGRGYSPKPYYLSKTDGTFSNHGGYLYTYWDMNPPTIEDLSLDLQQKEARIRVVDYDRVNNWQLSMWDTQTFKAKFTSNGQETVLTPSWAENPDYQTKLRGFDLRQVTDGTYTLIVEVIDTYGNTATLDYWQTITIDNTAPALALYRNGIPLASGDSVGALGDITFTLEDNLDQDPSVTSIKLTGGPANDDVNLAWVQQTGGAYKLEYPVMFPSMETGTYNLTINGKDWQGNTVTKAVSFYYAPPMVGLSSTGEDGTLLIPAANHTFTRPDGTSALKSATWTLSDGSPVVGQYDIYATMRTDAEVPLKINGVQVNPGDQMVVVASAYDFAANGGKVNLPVGAVQADLVGRSDLMLSTTAPGAPILVFPVRTWSATASMTSGKGSWDYEQVVEPVKATLVAGATTPCQLSSSFTQAKGSDPFVAPVCYVEWNTLPTGVQSSSSKPPTVEGRAVVGVGPQTISYTVSLLDSDGTKIILTTGQQEMNITAASTLSYGPNKDVSQVIRKLETIKFGMKQDSGFSCPMTTDAQEAMSDAASGRLKCVLQWDLLPGNLIQSVDVREPSLSGTIDEQGTFDLGWSIKAFTATGESIILQTQTYPIQVNNPPLPEVILYSKMGQTEDGTLTSSMWGGDFGYVYVQVPRAAADITLELDGIAEGHITTQYSGWNQFGAGDVTTFSRYVKLGEKPLWDRSPVTATAYYTQLPDVKTTRTVDVLRIPPERVYLSLETPRETLDIDGAPVKLSVGEMGPEGLVYNPERVGDWTFEIGTVTREAPFTPIVPSTPLTNGGYEGSIEGLGVGYTVLKAIARVSSPDGTYTREIESPRRFFAVFRGASPDADVVSRTFSGPAPFRIVLSLAMDRESRVVLGDIAWEFSADNGATWEAIPSGAIPWRAMATFEEGKYLVRAKVQNRKSGEIGYTESIQIQAFKIPTLEIQGPRTVLVGGEVELEATTTLNDAPVDAIIEWTNQTGEIIGTGPSHTFTPTEIDTMRFFVRAKLPDAPADNPQSWDEQRHYVQVKPPAPPRGQIRMPYYMEAGTAYDLEAVLYPPYWGMDETAYPISGEWTLPDGTTATGRNIQYTPTKADAAAGKVPFIYTAWIDGFRTTGAEASLQRDVRIGEYIWPNFETTQIQRIQQAPSDVILQVNPVDYSGRLEDPTYTWSLPASAVITYDYGQRVRVNFTEPGTFDVSVRVEDARGSIADVTTQVVTIPADPYVFDPYIVPSNKAYHAPLTLTVWPKHSGGHPQDRMESYKYILNGEEVPTTTSTAYLSGLPAGVHTLRIEGTSRFEKTPFWEQTVEVLENQPPGCTVTQTRLDRDTNPLYVMDAACSDTDGYVAGYQWYLDDTLVNSSYKVGVPIPTEGTTSTLVLKVVDNSKGVFTETFNLTP